MARILVVEDEQHLASGIKFNLELEGYDVEVISDGRQALTRLAPPALTPHDDVYDLILLDVMLPGVDGFRIVKAMREAGNYTPVLLLTAKTLPADVVEGLDAGADDYLPKPFDLPVLLARVKGLMRRRDWAREVGAPATARVGAAEVDFRTFEIHREGVTNQMTLLEAMLLKLLVQNAGRIVSKGEILEKVWNVSADTETRAVDNFILRLRRYLESDPSSPRHLTTVRGLGYRLDP